MSVTLLKNLLLQAVIFIAIFQSLSWFKGLDMVDTDTRLPAQQLTLTTTVGETVSLTPSKKTVIYFFAPWCSICHVSIDNLQAIYQKNEDINVIAVALDYVDNAEVNQFVSKHQLTFPVAYGNEEVKRLYKISGYPSYYVVDEQNTVIGKSMGYSTELGLYLRTL